MKVKSEVRGVVEVDGPNEHWPGWGREVVLVLIGWVLGAGVVVLNFVGCFVSRSIRVLCRC